MCVRSPAARGKRTSSAFYCSPAAGRSEILTLRWQDVDGDTLNLSDAWTGPRRIFLNMPPLYLS